MQIGQIIVGVLETGVIGFVVYMIIRGLKVEIKSLQKKIIAQNETINTMDKRISETEKIGDLYKRLISDFPKALDDYQAIITKTKDTAIIELSSQVEEQKLTIEELKTKANEGGKDLTYRAAVIEKIFLGKEHFELLKFIQTIDEDKNKILEAMFKHTVFDDFLKSIQKEVKYIEDESSDLLSRAINEKTNFKALSLLKNGSYMVTLDNKLVISKHLFNEFKVGYESIV